MLWKIMEREQEAKKKKKRGKIHKTGETRAATLSGKLIC